jgi:hypothetical protein
MVENRPDEKFDALLRYALSRAPTTEPPPGFAREVASLAADQPEGAAIEIWFTRALMSVSVVATGACGLMFVDTSRVLHLFERAPWPLLLATAAVFGAIELAENAQTVRLGRISRR